jgi:predicted DNA-binding transcriptional regulator AlpA
VSQDFYRYRPFIFGWELRGQSWGRPTKDVTRKVNRAPDASKVSAALPSSSPPQDEIARLRATSAADIPRHGPDDLLTEGELARFLKMAPGTLRNWRTSGEGPPFLSLSSRAVRYRFADVEAWVNARRRRSTSAPTRGSDDGRTENLSSPKPSPASSLTALQREVMDCARELWPDGRYPARKGDLHQKIRDKFVARKQTPPNARTITRAFKAASE